MKQQRLALIERLNSRTADGHLLAMYLCSCGQKKALPFSRVKNNYIRSCGCLSRETKPRLTHGRRKKPEYSSWVAMKGRCLSSTHKDYPRYGGVGITVCEEWASSFEEFFSYLGPRPTGTSLDRIDWRKGYEPGNVRWATNSQQSRNKANFTVVDTPNGRMGLVDYADIIGLSRGAAHLRLKRGKLEGVCRV